MSTLLRILVVVLIGYSDISASSQATWRYKTACYGSDPDCSDYKIECGDGEHIVIGSLQYGGKRTIQRCQFGLSNCEETLTLGNTTKTVDAWCCTYDPHDYLTNFSVENRTSVISNCNGRQTCTGSVPRIFKVTYSSYIWMQYTCLSDHSSAKMCKNNNISGSDVFVTFNLSQGYIFPSLSGSRDCTCQVHSLNCFSNLELTIHALNFRSSTSANHSLCSNAILELAPSLMLNCSSHNLLPVTYRVMSWKDTIAIRQLFTRDAMDRPDFIVIQIKAINTASSVFVECYPPGLEPVNDFQCPHTAGSISPVSPPASRSQTTTLSDILSLSISALISRSPTTTLSTNTFEALPTVATTSTSRRDVSTTTNTISNTINVTGTKHGYKAVNVESTPVPETHTRDVNTESGSQTTNLDSVTTLKTPDVVSSNLEYSSNTISTLSVDHLRTSTETVSLHSMSSSSRSSTTWRHLTSIYSNGSVSHGQMNYSTQVTGLSPTVIASDISFPISTPSIPYNETIDHSTPSSTITDSDSGLNDKLIIGLTVGVVLTIVTLVAIVSICCFVRLKRREKGQRSYVQNTSIFYSVPEDYAFTDNVSYEPAEMVSDTGNQESTIPLHSSTNGSLKSPPTCSMMDKKSPEKDHEYHGKQQQAELDLFEDDLQGEVANFTITFVNSVEPEARYTTANDDTNHVMADGNPVAHPKRVFDPHCLYSQVRKEGKTKF